MDHDCHAISPSRANREAACAALRQLTMGMVVFGSSIPGSDALMETPKAAHGASKKLHIT
jgi:hypothetical protein